MEADLCGSMWVGGQPVRDPACHTDEGGLDAKGHRHRTRKDMLLLQRWQQGPRIYRTDKLPSAITWGAGLTYKPTYQLSYSSVRPNSSE